MSPEAIEQYGIMMGKEMTASELAIVIGTCPYCKIRFCDNQWAAPKGKVVCINCRNYADSLHKEDK